MSETAPGPGIQWDVLNSRVTHYDLAVVIRRDADTGDVSTVAIDWEGVTEIPGAEAYFHPSVTAGIETVSTPHPWDEALDRLYELPLDDRKFALKEVRAGSGGKDTTPWVVLQAIKQQLTRRKNRTGL